MSVSWTLYDTGSHGTWLCYFINNHPEHAKANLNITLHPKNLQDNVDDVLTTDKITEYGVLPEVNGCMWTIGDPFTPPEQGRVNLKIFPAHALNGYGEQYEQLLKDTQCEKVIVVNCEPGIMLDKLLERLYIIRPEWKRDLDEEKGLGRNMRIEPYLEQSSVPVHYVDIGKILTGDEDEYNLMLDFLDERPLADWKDYVQKVHDDIYASL